ncbi:MAG: hypothetical protein WBA93_32465 [Microcoleaceae cyanobacterium]
MKLELKPKQLIKQIGVTDADALEEYMKTLEFGQDQYKAANNRKILPIKHQFVGHYSKPMVAQGYRDERIEKFLDIAYPGWEIALALHYRPGGNVDLHRDATGYGQLAISVSSTDFVFRIENERHECQRGAIYLFRTKVLHGTEPLDRERFTIVAWKIDWRKINYPEEF